MTAAADATQGIVRWRYLWGALLAIAGMIASIVIGNVWLLNFVHVFSSLIESVVGPVSARGRRHSS
jgi:hypothetical protein